MILVEFGFILEKKMLNKGIYLLIFLFCCMSIKSFSQGEGDNWYFGRYAGLNFSTTPPTILTNGHLTTGEGCAAVSSKAGNLLFYTDGIFVWDANHNLMPNGSGLLGNPSSTQSAVICPKPGTYNYGLKRFDSYYIITIDYQYGPNGVRYSEVDMNLNGSLGDVLVSNKNTHLFGTTTVEGANVARHSNGCDYWIIGKEAGNNTFNVYSITSAGVNLTPVISNAGSTTPSAWGNIKVSPNNRLVALANSNGVARTQVFDFDNNTGQLAFKFSDNLGGYTLEFSSDNNLLYAARLNNSNIYQYDLTTLNNAAFQASRTIIGTTGNIFGYKMCALQMAPNGKIYAALQNLDYLGCINDPNILGAGCNYVDNGQSIAGTNTFSGTTIINSLGLPAFPSFFITQPIAINSKKLCFNDQTEFQLSDTTLVNLIEWTVTDINSILITQSTDFEPVFQFPDTGKYIVSTIVHFPCYIDSSISDTITIIGVDDVFLGADTILCIGDSVAFDAGVGYDHYIWNSGDTSQLIYVDTTGQFIVQVLKESEDSLCEKRDTIMITAFPIPEASFSFTYECFGTISVLSDNSNSNGGIITNWAWDFDNDGIVDTNAQNTSYLFSNAGQFPVNLVVATAGGACFHDTTINCIVNPVPAADFSFLNVCANDTAIMIENAFLSNGSIVSYDWDFGDGPPAGTSSLQNPNYVYDTAGTYIIVLTVMSDSGCNDVKGIPIEIYSIPKAGFLFTDVCLYDLAIFTDTSIINSGIINSWIWDFGDGATSTNQNTSHLYNADTSFIVKLVLVSNKGCIDSVENSITIHTVPNADYYTTAVCLYDSAEFNDNSTVINGTINSWDWQFGDGSSSTLQNPIHNYSTDGTYAVSLVISSNYFCTDTVTLPLQIHPIPVAVMVINPVCLNDSAFFTDASTINSPGINSSWLWDFGDLNGTSNLQDPTYIYTSDGVYTINLSVTSADGCIGDTNFSFEVYPLPIVSFTSDTSSGCEPFCVSFIDATSISSGNIGSWSWDFGDGDSSTIQFPQHCYSALDASTARYATIRLIAISSDGCLDSLTKSNMINVWPKPIAGFSVNPQPTTILAPIVAFTDQSIGISLSWSWDFGDGTNLFDLGVEGANQSHAFLDTGHYTVIQILKNQHTCSDTVTRLISIDPDYIFHIPNSFTPNGDGYNDVFIPKIIGLDIASFEMIIYNRWGGQVFRTDKYHVPWDGSGNNNNQKAQQGVYVWVVYTTDLSERKHQYFGRVTLLR